MVRFLFLLHRYLGIGIGLIMLLWTLSGVVMMYKPYPELNRWQSLSLRDTLQFEGCCRLPDSPITQADTFSSIRVEMLQGSPVLRMSTVERGPVSFNLATGRAFVAIDAPQAGAVAQHFVQSSFAAYFIVAEQQIDIDQWTISGSHNSHRPLHKYRVDDPAGTEFYISSRTGEIVQLTTADQRLWGYLGAVIHWLYPTVLRQHPALWSQVVIWLSVIGVFLTVTGIYIGVRQLRQRAGGRRSPYSGVQLYHHYTGLVFGLFTLSWVASGLLSMNPWGTLQGEGIGPESRRLAGDMLAWSEVEPLLQNLNQAELPDDTVMLEIFPQQSKASLVAHTVRGDKLRLNPVTLARENLTPASLKSMAEGLRPRENIADMEILTKGDAYYYVHHQPREFPIYKVIFDGGQRRLYYLSPVDGRIQFKVDGSLRLYRWLFNALHRGDFSPLSRQRPVWDLFMLSLLAGVTVVCATGAYLGWRRLKPD
jgi:uncharacterized iron-regulated membrane protein